MLSATADGEVAMLPAREFAGSGRFAGRPRVATG
jgi:hypothetical protein